MIKLLKATGVAAGLLVSVGLAQAEELRIGTASLGGAFYPMGQSISNLVNKYAGDDISMVPVVTGGSVQNPRLIDSGEVEIAITNNNLAVLAVNGKGPYKSGAIEMSAVAALHPSVLHMIVLEDSDIKTIEDLKGKRVAVGPAGGGTLGFMNFLLPLHGMSMDDIVPSFLSYSDGFSQLSDGNVDAAFALSGYPAGAVMQAAAGNKLRFISFSDGIMDKALEKNGAFKSVEIPADVYGTAEPGQVIGVNNMLIVPNSLSADVVEKIVASVFDHLEEFQEENANAKQIDPANSLKLAIPLHEGAARYFNK
ncbi:MAG: TAXI family TRAP transporter solute-binding subunit [Roseibium sp.]|uniref:TAXI family TRAP transporter solute-binding subunit n=1 Tax=Roseibium sp. TaxID=1936156 RepID=UPI001B13681F|nr:TAXI family TRAP transporter solute-binding subunit [Roseibium sp.]MBO6507640.1 TAXI family TRAP transporter solute-binding subunit [Roseibium sp.]MBO6893771.1 TAXI family TRAP transporter solute-binding subunit [Roseibium sp.]MBO6928592.1 TAXI family TRAP transporter solute-binding subunit [Roseibium sp.]